METGSRYSVCPEFGDLLADRLKLSRHLVVHLPEQLGRTHTAQPIAALDLAIGDGRLAAARRTLFVAVGAGITVTLAEYRRPKVATPMMIASRLATPAGRGGRVVVGALIALVGFAFFDAVVAFLVIMLGAEIAVGGVLNVCVLCPLFGKPIRGSRAPRAAT